VVQILVWTGPNRPSAEGTQLGDIVTILDDGQHPGRKIVTGAGWDGPCDYSTLRGRALTSAEMAGGERPDFNIVDIDNTTIAQFKNALGVKIAEALSLAVVPRRLKRLPKISKINPAALPTAARRSLRNTGRVLATGAQFLGVLALKDGVTKAKIIEMVTRQGRDSGELVETED
jgi:hypothetical protein